MQAENDYDKDVFNGGLGLVRRVDRDEGELGALALAYATTVHQAQGSEYPAVVILVTTQHWPMLRRNLLYTGVTRGRRLVVLVAQPKAVAMAVRGQQEHRRWAKLREWLGAGGASPASRRRSWHVWASARGDAATASAAPARGSWRIPGRTCPS
jgi:exodeoxyribonuclease V alpha subunit